MLGDPVTDLTIAMELDYFQLNRAEYFVPIVVKIPGRELALAKRFGVEAAQELCRLAVGVGADHAEQQRARTYHAGLDRGGPRQCLLHPPREAVEGDVAGGHAGTLSAESPQ